MEDKIYIMEQAVSALLQQKTNEAAHIIKETYPFTPVKRFTRSYTDRQKMEQYVKDGFIDCYSGKKMLNPGILRVLSFYLPEEFPFQTNWRMDACHIAYWEYAPTVDHIYPIARGGKDEPLPRRRLSRVGRSHQPATSIAIGRAHV